jgi:hypothetical protein
MKKFLTKGRLFKFLPYNQYLFNLLVNGELWMSPPDKLNDPFEGDFQIREIGQYQNNEFIKKLLAFKRKNFIDDFAYDENFNKSINDEYYFSNILYEYINEIIRNKFGISCFTRNPENLKMWSHYADSHKGVCLIFDEETLRYNTAKRVGISMSDVNYSKTLPFVQIINHDADENGDDFIGINERDNSFLFNKLTNWKEEKEVRLLLNNDFSVFTNRTLKFDLASIKGVVFGARVDTHNLMTVVNLIETSKHFQKTEFYLAQKDLKNSSIKIQRLKV